MFCIVQERLCIGHIQEYIAIEHSLSISRLVFFSSVFFTFFALIPSLFVSFSTSSEFFCKLNMHKYWVRMYEAKSMYKHLHWIRRFCISLFPLSLRVFPPVFFCEFQTRSFGVFLTDLNTDCVCWMRFCVRIFTIYTLLFVKLYVYLTWIFLVQKQQQQQQQSHTIFNWTMHQSF